MPVKNAVKQQKRWLSVATRERFLLPREARAGAPVQAVTRALLLEGDCCARPHYDGILDAIAPTEAGRGLQSLNAIPASRRRTHAYQRRVEAAITPFAEAILPSASEFAEKWEFGSPAGACMIASFAVLDLLGIDPLDVESARETIDIWRLIYGAQTTRQARAARHAARGTLKDQGWRQFDDGAMMDTARFWVRVHHVHHSLTAALQEKYRVCYDDSLPEDKREYYFDYDLDMLDGWSKRLRPFDEVLGRERRTGRSTSV